MHIGEAATKAGLPAKTIRFYEEIGLVKPALRAENGYRSYADRDVHVLQFLHRARSLGFSVEDCRELLALYQDRRRASSDVKAVALARIVDIETKIEELQSMKAALSHLAKKCHGDDRPDCPILDDLAGAFDA
jgi:Cu(I)-responsive transcriptional regulator